MSSRSEISRSQASLNWTAELYECVSAASMAKTREITADILAAVKHLKELDSDLCGSLEHSVERLQGEEITITFAGRFKCGKSLLLNKLINRKYLPVNTEAETGAPCVIRSGLSDAIQAVRSGRRENLELSEHALRTELSLWQRRNGQIDTALADRIDIFVGGGDIPARAVWVDTPGFDDNEEMDAVTRRTMLDADILIWTLSSESLLSQTEARYVSEFTEAVSPRSVLLATNIMMNYRTSYPSQWDEFVVKRKHAVHARLQEYAPVMGIPPKHLRMVLVSAMPMRDEPGYGMEELLSLLKSASSPQHRLVRWSRLDRLKGNLDKAVNRCATLLVDAEGNVERLAELRQRWEQEEAKQWKLFGKRIQAVVARFFRQANQSFSKTVSELRNSINADTLVRDETYQHKLIDAVSTAFAKDPIRTLVKEILEEAKKCGHGTNSQALTAKLLTESASLRLLVPGIEVPNSQISFGKATAVALGVGMLGAVTFGAGWLIGGGAAVASLAKQSNEAVERDVAGLRENIDSAGAYVCASISSLEAKFLDLILAAIDRESNPHEQADSSKVRSLKKAMSALQRAYSTVEQVY